MSLIDQAVSQMGPVETTGAAAAFTLSQAIDAFGPPTQADIANQQPILTSTYSPVGVLGQPAIAETTVPIGGAPSVSSGGGTSSSGSSFGAAGEWEAIHYANDMIAHQPKFKFLFKVKFEGFGAEMFYYYVQRCDKPKIIFMHQDVNYYNFRSKVLTQTQFTPLSITFYDEIGNSTNNFFVEYMKHLSGQGSGNWGIDKGFGEASSTKPYHANKGYSHGRKITIEQIFANGVLSNRFIFINPRIEQFDFDEMSMEDTGFNVMTCTFHYDALKCETVQRQTIHSWGNTDLLRGGGTSGPQNAGSSQVGEGEIIPTQSASGNGMDGPSPINYQSNAYQTIINDNLNGAPNIINNAVSRVTSTYVRPITNSVNGVVNGINGAINNITNGINGTINNAINGVTNGINNTINNAIGGITNGINNTINNAIGGVTRQITGLGTSVVSSAYNTISRDINSTLNSVTSGANLNFGGVNSIAGGINNITNGINNTINNISGAINNIENTATTYISDGINNAIGQVSAEANAIIGNVTDMLNTDSILGEFSDFSSIEDISESITDFFGDGGDDGGFSFW